MCMCIYCLLYIICVLIYLLVLIYLFFNCISNIEYNIVNIEYNIVDIVYNNIVYNNIVYNNIEYYNKKMMEDFRELFLSFQLQMKEMDEYIFIELPIKTIDEIPIFSGLQIQLVDLKKISFIVKSKIIKNCGNRIVYFNCNLFSAYMLDNDGNKNDDCMHANDIENDIHAIEYTYEEFEIALKMLLEILPTLTFNKIQGRFLSTIEDINKIGYYNSLKYANNFHKVWSIALNFPNIKLIYDECSVCGSNTEIKTPCNHSLCYTCWEQIKINKDKDENNDDEYYQICPICRKIINKFN